MLLLQIATQDTTIGKMGSSRLAMDLPVFKESDLDFQNLYSGLPGFEVEQKHVHKVMGTGTEATFAPSETSGSEKEVDEHPGLEVQTSGGGYAMMRFLQQNQDEKVSSGTPVHEKKRFNTFNQVMLALPKVEEGLLSFLKDFEKRSSSYRSCGVLALVAEELIECLKLCGVGSVNPIAVFDFVKKANEYIEPLDDLDDKTQELEVTFGQVIGSQFAVDLFAPEFETAENSSKVSAAFQIIRSTFNLLDGDGDGEISPEELQSSRDRKSVV